MAAAWYYLTSKFQTIVEAKADQQSRTQLTQMDSLLPDGTLLCALLVNSKYKGPDLEARLTSRRIWRICNLKRWLSKTCVVSSVQRANSRSISTKPKLLLNQQEDQAMLTAKAEHHKALLDAIRTILGSKGAWCKWTTHMTWYRWIRIIEGLSQKSCPKKI